MADSGTKDIGAALKEAADRMAAMDPVDRALMLDDQAAAFSGGTSSVLASAVRSLRAQLAAMTREMDFAKQCNEGLEAERSTWHHRAETAERECEALRKDAERLAGS